MWIFIRRRIDQNKICYLFWSGLGRGDPGKQSIISELALEFLLKVPLPETGLPRFNTLN